MGLFLKQSTAITLQIGPFIDSGDGNTDEDGFTLTQEDILLSKNGGVFAAKTEASNCTYDTGGFYRCPIDATDTNTLGRLQLDVHVVGALHVYHEFTVVTANVWDTLCGADKLDIDKDDEIDAIKLKTDNLPSDPADESNIVAEINANETKIDALQTDVTAIKGYVDTEVAAIKAVTDTLSLAAIADAVHDEAVEGAYTFREVQRLISAALAGKLSGGGTGTLTFRDLNDTKNRIIADVDVSKNRTAVVLDES